jgi:hypothetical protein
VHGGEGSTLVGLKEWYGYGCETVSIGSRGGSAGQRAVNAPGQGESGKECSVRRNAAVQRVKCGAVPGGRKRGWSETRGCRVPGDVCLME